MAQKIYDLMLYTTSPHPERETDREKDRVHVLTRSAGRLQPALGPCEFRGEGWRERKGRGVETGRHRLESSLVSTGFIWSGRKERLQHKQDGTISTQ